MDINYVKSGDYYIPDLKLTEEEQKPIGKYGRMRRDFLKQYRPAQYASLCLKGTLWPHLLEIDEAAGRFMEDLMRLLAEQAGVTEALKASDPLAWTQQMNSLQAQAEEIVLSELVLV